jgi:hypothetical protein
MTKIVACKARNGEELFEQCFDLAARWVFIGFG